MSETTIEEAPAIDETDAVEEESPVYVEVNHRGGPAHLAAIHIDGQQAFDVISVEAQLDVNDSDDVTVTLTHADGTVTTAKVAKLDIVGTVEA